MLGAVPGSAQPSSCAGPVLPLRSLSFVFAQVALHSCIFSVYYSIVELTNKEECFCQLINQIDLMQNIIIF